MLPVRSYNGLEPNKVSTHVLEINDGSFTDYDGNAWYSFRAQWPSPAYRVDLTHLGVGGSDRLYSRLGGEFYFYLVGNAGIPGVLASPAKFAGDVFYPAGWSFLRKMPFGFIYNDAWDGIPDFHVPAFNTSPFIYSQAERSGLWCPLYAGAATAWTTVDLSSWLPDNARMAHVTVEGQYASGTAGSIYLRSYGRQLTGRFCGSVSPGSPFCVSEHSIRVTSDRHLDYMTTGTGARAYVWVTGYSFTEPA